MGNSCSPGCVCMPRVASGSIVPNIIAGWWFGTLFIFLFPTDYSNFSEGLKPPTRLGGIKEGIGRISRYLNTPPQYRSWFKIFKVSSPCMSVGDILEQHSHTCVQQNVAAVVGWGFEYIYIHNIYIYIYVYVFIYIHIFYIYILYIYILLMYTAFSCSWSESFAGTSQVHPS